MTLDLGEGIYIRGRFPRLDLVTLNTSGAPTGVGRTLRIGSDTYVDASFYKRDYIDGSLNSKLNKTLFDTSIASLTNWNISQDASLLLKADKTEIYSKTYIDGSLNAKQPLGNYVKEASLGTSFIWNAGILDVSVEGGLFFSRCFYF